MTPRRLAFRALLALATITVIGLLVRPGPHDEPPADEPPQPLDRPDASPAASKPPPPTVFAAWAEGERSFVLLDRPADVVVRAWDKLPSGIGVAPAPSLAQPLELTLVNPAGWKHVATAEQIVVDTSWLDSQHTGWAVAHRTAQRAARAPTTAVAFVGVDLDGHTRGRPEGAGSHFRIAIAGHVDDPKWFDGVRVLSRIACTASPTDSEREARAWAESVGQNPNLRTSNVRVGRLTADIDALVGCNRDPCVTYLRFRGQDWYHTTGRVYGILELAGRRYLVLIDADFSVSVIDLSV
jgi:hypothetical protein